MIDTLHYISQQPPGDTHLSAIRNALEAGCKWIQLRVKGIDDNTLLQQAIAANGLCGQYGAKLIINDNPHIAVRSGAYGVHLGLQDMAVAEARRLVGGQMVIGGTANTIDDIVQRAAAGVDYIGLGPFRFTATKQQLSPVLGIDGYMRIMEQVKAKNINIPIIAIGGILRDDVGPLLATGVYGIAMSGAITYAEDRRALVAGIYQQSLHFR